MRSALVLLLLPGLKLVSCRLSRGAVKNTPRPCVSHPRRMLWMFRPIVEQRGARYQLQALCKPLSALQCALVQQNSGKLRAWFNAGVRCHGML